MAAQSKCLQQHQLIQQHYLFKSPLMLQQHKNHGDIFWKHRRTVNCCLDWESFAWGKESTNTVVAASKKFLEDEEFVNAYLTAHVKAVEFIEQNPEESQDLVSQAY